MSHNHIHFVTGRLAEHSLRQIVEHLAPEVGFDYSINVMNITVAALMTPEWIAARIDAPAVARRIIVPGYCEGDLAPIERAAGLPVERGPRDLRQLPEYFGQPTRSADYGHYQIEILAEINHCPRLSLAEILDEARRLRNDGADVIDVGCDPGHLWSDAGRVVSALVDEGHRVSIDSMNPAEIALAAKAGAELVLSVNSTNRCAAADWGCEVVAVPDVPEGLVGLEETIEALCADRVPLRIDLVLEPVSFGFASSLGRYLECRAKYPDAEMMMGIGNLTELTDVDSAGLNVLLLGFCEELSIRSVLTTQVINWARTSVRECDLGRRLVHYAVANRVLPKHLEPRLLTLRDERLLPQDPEELSRLASQLKDHNYRIFADAGIIHVVSAGLHLSDADPFRLFEKLLDTDPKNIDPSHAYYLGYEMCKAATALTLGKQYEQDEPLDWGYLTAEEKHHRLSRKGTK